MKVFKNVLQNSCYVKALSVFYAQIRNINLGDVHICKPYVSLSIGKYLKSIISTNMSL